MDINSKILASILGGLLLLVIVLPILVGGTQSLLFTMLFWLLGLAITITLLFVVTDRRQQR